MTLLERCVAFEMRTAADGGDGLTLEGYGAVFDKPTRIDSWEGTFDEVIARGAFAKTIREGRPVMQFNHGRDPVIGSLPIGAISDLREDDQGLFVSARLNDNWLVQPVRDAIANKSINGMSFRFAPVKEEWRTADGKPIKPENVRTAIYAADPENIPVRTLKEVRMPELGPVVFPAYAETSVGVRSLDPALAALLERLDPDSRAALARTLNGTFVAPSGSGEPGDPEAARTTEPDAHSADPSRDDEATRRAAAHARHRRALREGLHNA